MLVQFKIEYIVTLKDGEYMWAYPDIEGFYPSEKMQDQLNKIGLLHMGGIHFKVIDPEKMTLKKGESFSVDV